MMSPKALKWTAYIAGGAMAVAFILPFISYDRQTDEDGNDWHTTRGSNAVLDLARENARASFQHFVDALERTGPLSEDFEVEVELRSQRGVPTVVWLYAIEVLPDEMSGVLTVTPPGGLRGGFSEGDRVRFTRYQVGDWKYPEEGRWRGNFVLRVSLSEYSDEKRAEVVKYLHESPIP